VDVDDIGTIRSGLTYMYFDKPGSNACYGKARAIINVGGDLWIQLRTFTFNLTQLNTRLLRRKRCDFVQMCHIICVVEVGLQNGKVVVTRHLH
jgi:hypothetical protein